MKKSKDPGSQPCMKKEHRPYPNSFQMPKALCFGCAIDRKIAKGVRQARAPLVRALKKIDEVALEAVDRHPQSGSWAQTRCLIKAALERRRG